MTSHDLIARPNWSEIIRMTLLVTAIFAAGLVGGIVGAVGFGWLATTVHLETLITQIVPAGEKTAWYLSRSSAIVAYILLSGSMIWGLALSTKVVRDIVPAPLAMALHGFLSWFALGMAGFHAAVLLFDGYYQYTLADLFVPFAGPYRPVVVGIGILAFYGLFLTTSSFAARKWIGQRTWRRLHYLTFVLYVAVTAHGVLAGTDSGNRGIELMYWSSVLVVLFLTNYRLLTLPKKNATHGKETKQLDPTPDTGHYTLVPQPVHHTTRPDRYRRTR